MSYKKKKLKKGLLNKLKRALKLLRIALLKKYKLFIQKNRIFMQQRQTRDVMKWLREWSKIVRQNNLRISDWVDEYIDSCVLNGKPVEILTQYCLSKGLESRYVLQGNTFTPLSTELDMFKKEIPRIISMFKSNGMRVNWYITFNDSFIEKGLVDKPIAEAYIVMIKGLVENSELLLLNWEDEVLKGRPKPNKKVLSNFFSFVSRDAYKIAMNDLVRRTEKFTDFEEIKKGFDEGLQFKIACEAEEGLMLVENQNLFFEEPGQFILAPLEFPERYVFFGALVPDFQKRIVPILKSYPWRIETGNTFEEENLYGGK